MDDLVPLSRPSPPSFQTQDLAAETCDSFGGIGRLPQTANRYSDALNGPYRYADPSGHFVNAVYANGPMLLSVGLQSVPVVGDLYGAFTGVVGFDPIAGVSSPA